MPGRGTGPQSLELAVGHPNKPFFTSTLLLGPLPHRCADLFRPRRLCSSPDVLHTLTLEQQWAVPWTVHARDGEEPGPAGSLGPRLHRKKGGFLGWLAFPNLPMRNGIVKDIELSKVDVHALVNKKVGCRRPSERACRRRGKRLTRVESPFAWLLKILEDP